MSHHDILIRFFSNPLEISGSIPWMIKDSWSDDDDFDESNILFKLLSNRGRT